MNCNSLNAFSQQKNHQKLNLLNSFFINKFNKNVTDPFNSLNIKIKTPEKIAPKIEIFINNMNELSLNYRFTAAVAEFIAALLNIKTIKLEIINNEIWIVATDQILKRKCLGLYDRKTYSRIRKYLVDTKICIIKNLGKRRNKITAKGVKYTQRDTTSYYNLNRALLKQYGVTKQMLYDYAWIKSSKVRKAYKQANIIVKSEDTLRKKKLYTLIKIEQKKNVPSSYIKNKVYYNNNRKIEIFKSKKETFSTKSIYSPYHRLRDFTQERLNQEKMMEINIKIILEQTVKKMQKHRPFQKSMEIPIVRPREHQYNTHRKINIDMKNIDFKKLLCNGW